MNSKNINEANRFIHGAFVLTVTTAIVKVIGFLFTIPIANLLGANGMSYFYSAYNIYNMLTALAIAGLPVAVSRMISESTQKNNPANTARIYRIALTAFSVIGLFVSLIMFLGADAWAGFIANPNSGLAIRVLSVTAFLSFTMSALRGYFQGHSDMIPTAVSQITESMSKLVIGCILVYYIMNTGGSYEVGAAGAIMGVSVGAILATVILFMYKRRYTKLYYGDITEDITRTDKDILGELFKISIPIALGSSVMSIVTFFDNTIIMRQLQFALNYTLEEAEWLFGTYGNANKIFNLPSAFIIPFSVSIIPALGAAITRENKEQIAFNIASAFKFPMMISFPAGIGLAVLSFPILSIVYFSRPDEVAVGAPLLSVLGLAVILYSVMTITNAVLQSYKKVNFSMFAMLVGAVVKLILNWILVGIESVNIMGAPIATCACYAVIMVMNLLYMRKLIPKGIKIIRTLMLILLSGLIMGGAAFAVYNVTDNFVSVRIAGVLAIAIAAVIYFAFIMIFKVVTVKELKSALKNQKIVT